MKTIVKTEALKAALARVRKLPGDGAFKSITKIEVADIESIRITRTSSAGTISVDCEAEVEGDFCLCLDGEMMSGLISRMKGDTLEVTHDEQFIEIKCDKSKVKLSLLSNDLMAAYPELLSNPIEINYPIEEFVSAMQCAVPSAGQTPELMGVCFRNMKGDVYAFSTDRKRLHAADMGLKTEGLDFFIPSPIVASVVDAFSKSAGAAKILITDSKAEIITDGAKMRFGLMETKPPSIEVLLDFRNAIEGKSKVNREEIMDSVAAAAPASLGDAKAITLKFKKKSCEIIADNGGSALFTDEIEAEGDAFEIRVNASYFTAAMSAIKTNEVTILNVPSRSAMLVDQEGKFIMLAGIRDGK